MKRTHSGRETSKLTAALLAALLSGCSSQVTVFGDEATDDAAAGDGGARGEAPHDDVEPRAPLDGCEPGEPASILATVASPEGLALSDDTLFLSDGGDLYGCDGAIYAVPLSGGDPELLIGGLCAPNRIAYHGGQLFVLRHSGYVTPNGTLERFDPGQGQLVTLASGLISPDALAVDERYVYVGAEATTGLQSPGRLLRVDRDTGEQFELATSAGRPAAIALDDDYVYWGSSVAFLNGKPNSDSEVLRIPKSGGSAQLLVQGLSWPHGLARAGTRLFVANNDGGAILSLEADGSDLLALVGGVDAPQSVAVADGSLYFTTWGEVPGSLQRASATTPGPSTLHIPGIGGADQIALGRTCVYWTERYVDEDFNGVVRRAPR